MILDTTNKDGQQIYNYNNGITDYICPKFVKVFNENEIVTTDITKTNPFRDDMYSTMMFRGLEKDEQSIGQTYEEYKKW